MSGMTMLDYVQECPLRLRANLTREAELCDALSARYLTACKAGTGRLRLVACGSSYHACRAMQPFMMRVLAVDIDVVTPGAYVRYAATMPDAFEIMVSQSGCSTNVIAALDCARTHGRTTVALTGNVASDVREHADCVVDYGVGTETVGFVTVGLVTLMEYLALFALNVARNGGTMTSDEHRCWVDELDMAAQLHGELSARMQRVFNEQEKVFLTPGPTFVLGDGPNYATALEGALKIQETLKVPAIVYEPEEYIHGPNMQLTPGYTAFVIDTDGAPGRTYDIWQATRTVTDRAFLVSTRANGDEHAIAVDGADISEPVSPICLVAPFQYLCARAMAALSCEDVHPLMRRFDNIVASKTENYRETHAS